MTSLQTRRDGSSNAYSLYAVATLVVFVLSSVNDGVSATEAYTPQIFEVLTGPWSDCRPINESLACYKSREVVCVRETDNATAPWYYCANIGLEKPQTLARCLGSDCVQDCAVTEWGSWSTCNDCSATFFRVRTRDIVLPARNGGKECPVLLQREKCLNCFTASREFESLPRTYTWRTGEWGDCITLDDTADCGHGFQTRVVDCMDMEGNVVNSSTCLFQETAYFNVFPPTTAKLCDVPCECTVEEWSPWSECMLNCSSLNPIGYRKRTRSILRPPTMEEICPDTEETELCHQSNYPNSCPSFSWETSEWSTVCAPQDEEASCGIGTTKRYAYCVRTLDGVSVTVDSSLCNNTVKPITRASCEIPCYQDCSVGEWTAWSECDKSCNATYRNRTRAVLLSPLAEGTVCPHLIEYKACPILTCQYWLPGEFSERCFLPSGTTCGFGTRSRDIDCVDLQGNVLQNSKCHFLGIPSNQENCYTPCPDGCVLSEWSPWTECTQTCGGTVGTQYRQRQILAEGSTCPFTESDLSELRNCSSAEPCVQEVYYIIEDPWELCRAEDTSLGGGDGQCGPGVQNRTAVCMKGDNAITPEECPIPFEEMRQQSCQLPCDCEYTDWTPWSECSVTCGMGMRTRSRKLLRFSDTEPDCFTDENNNGFEFDTAACEISTSCGPELAWYTSDYGDCVIFPSILSRHSDSSENHCGHGYQNRSVQCNNNTSGRMVEDELCLELGEEKPIEIQSCVVPCEDYCIVGEWSDYTECSADADQTRSREVITCTRTNSLDGCCPKLSSLQLTETIPCSRLDSTQYSLTLTARYDEECIISDGGTCGNGFMYAPYACKDRSSNLVPDDYCVSRDIRFPIQQRCTIKCDTDCELSEWSPWGECSVTCGRGLRTRTREVVNDQEELGRPCGTLLSETEICEETVACPYAEFVPGPFSNCSLNDVNSTCGMGMKTRQAICMIDSQEYDHQQCIQLGATITFDLSVECSEPCPGDCVLSEWGAWSQCSCSSDGNCQHERHRKILRSDCPAMLVEYQSCETYTWRAAENWTNCILPELAPGETHPNHYCGNGTQNRHIDCINNRTSAIVHDRFCESFPKPVQIRSCNVACPVDCLVGEFTEWTVCPLTCDEATSVQTRRRKILIQPSNGGRQCPSEVQEKPCPVNCYKYVYVSHQPRCLADYSAETQCGKSLQSQPISCRRNNDFVPPSECFEASRQGLTVEGLANPDIDLTTPSYCTIECPLQPMCNFTEWSAPSDCLTSCYDGENPFAFRTRGLVRSFDKHTNTCLASQYEYLDCPTAETQPNVNSNTSITTALAPSSECVSFSWQVTEWNSDDTRDISCETNNRVLVDGGCPLNLMPLINRYPCSSKVCPTYSSCNSLSGLCQCSNRSEKVEGICLPQSGCFEDSHCLIPNMQCDEAVGLCVCSPGFVLLNGVCTASPTTAPLTTTSSETTVGMTTALDSSTAQSTETKTTADETTGAPVTTEAGTGEGDAASLDTLEIVLIGTVPLVIVIVTVLILIFITYRCRVYLEKQQEESSKRRRAGLSISCPSPTPQTAEDIMTRLSRRGAESASSGFVDDLDNELQKYGMPGNSFNVSQHSKHSEDIDEAVFSSPSHLPQNPIPVPAPVIPVSNPLHNIHHHHHQPHPPHHPMDLQIGESNLDGRALNHQIVPGIPYVLADNYPDGDFTTATDVTYTTDEGSVIGTSVAPSSVGSPNIMRRGEEVPLHLLRSPERYHRSCSRGMENQYVDMQGQHVYASIKRGGHHHDYQHHHPHEQPSDYRSVKAYERQSRERSERSHDQSRETSHDYLSEPDYARSITPTSPTAHYHPSYTATPRSPTHISNRDCRIATGLDNSMVRAAAQMTDPQGPHSRSQEEQEFQRSTHHRSSGGRRSHRRRSGRRRRQHHNRPHGNNDPHHMTYHPSSRRDDYEYYHHDDGGYPPRRVARHYSEGDHDNYYYHSDHDTHAVYPAPSPSHYYPPSRSVPMTPTIPPGHHIPPNQHPHSPGVVHHPLHSQAMIQGHPPQQPYSPAVIHGYPPPHSPAVMHQQYSHDPHQPNIEVQPPTPASSRREDVVMTSSHNLPPGGSSPYTPTSVPRQQQMYEQHQPGGYSLQGSPYPQSASTPSLPTNVVPQPSQHTPLASGGDSYDNYDFPRRVHAHYTRQEQLRQAADNADSSHYAYPRSVMSSTTSVPSSTHNEQPPATSNITTDPPQQTTTAVTNPYVKSASLRSDGSTASSATTYVPQSAVSDTATTNSQPGSPYVVRRQHHPSPLVLHSSSSNSPANSSVYTPRGSAEVQQQHLNLSETLSSFDSSMAAAMGRENNHHQTSLEGQNHQQQQQQPGAPVHMQYQIHHQMQNGGPIAMQQ